MDLSPATVLVRRDAVPQARLGGNDLVLLNAERGSYYGLDGPSLRIWELLATPVSLAELCRTLTTEFAVDYEACLADTTAFCRSLCEEDLVERLDQPHR